MLPATSGLWTTKTFWTSYLGVIQCARREDAVGVDAGGGVQPGHPLLLRQLCEGQWEAVGPQWTLLLRIPTICPPTQRPVAGHRIRPDTAPINDSDLSGSGMR